MNFEKVQWADVVFMALGRGRDNAHSLSAIAEDLGIPRRTVEKAVQELRLRGLPVASGTEGVWVGDAADLDATARYLRGRLIAQYQTFLAVRRTAGRMRQSAVQQLSWMDAA